MTSNPSTPTSPGSPVTSAVTVIGLGPMGRALARALLRAGHLVTAWNRTPGKADDLRPAGALLAASPARALDGADMAVFCVVDDDAVGSIVERASHSAEMAGMTLINLSADSPARTRALADQVDALGITMVDGAIMTPAAAIGSEATRILYSGPRRAYEGHSTTLSAFGGTRFYLGHDIAAAATYDVSLLSLFWTSIAGVSQALALTRAEGLDVEEFTPHAVSMSRLVVDLLPDLAADFAAGRYAGTDSATIDSLAASLTHLRAAFVDSGITTSLMEPISSAVEDAARAGYGTDAPIRLADTLARHGHDLPHA